MTLVDDLTADLAAESGQLDDIVAPLEVGDWARPTPAPGWTIAHQIGHLLWTDRAALLAITDPDAFTAGLQAAVADPSGFVDAGAAVEAARPPAELLADWRSTRGRLGAALRSVPDGTKLLWFGPPMSAASMASARIMETWAHGLDVADALGLSMPPDDRIRHVVHLGVRTRNYAYLVNGLSAPDSDFRYEIKAPSGDTWTWGPEDAAEVIRGSAVDFASLVTQRRNLADLSIELIGDDARRWAGIAQCFAGPPGAGREPLGPSADVGAVGG